MSQRDSSTVEHDLNHGQRPLAPATGAGSQRFPKSVRLLKPAEFDRVYREGRRLTLPDMAVFWRAREAPEGASRVGFTAPRALGGAVVRNRIRRRVRAVVQQQLRGLRPAVDLVINPRRSAQAAEFAALVRQIEEAFRSITQGKGARPRPR